MAFGEDGIWFEVDMALSNQRVPTGNKQTEIGVIPEDWDVVQIGNAIGVYRGGSPRPIQQYIAKGSEGVNWIKIGDVSVGAKYIHETEEKIIPEGVKRSRKVNAGDFLLSNSMSFGRPYILSIEGCIHDGWLVLQDYQSSFNRDFLYYILSSQRVLNQYISKAAGSSVLNLNKELVSSVYLAKPVLWEQSAIATALSDVDSLISRLDALIKKKSLIKQGVMQELLTGKRRLPGFSGEWKKKRLGELADMSSGGTPSTSVADYYGGGIPWVSITDMTNIGKYLHVTERSLTEKGLVNSAAKIFPKGTVLYAMYASIGECCITTVAASTSQAILGIRPKVDLNGAYLYHYLSSKKTEVKAMGQQGTQSNLNAGIVRGFEVVIPSIQEQAAIVAILSDMDAEIEGLESLLSKYQNIKQGMMQALLTGKIRLL